MKKNKIIIFTVIIIITVIVIFMLLRNNETSKIKIVDNKFSAEDEVVEFDEENDIDIIFDGDKATIDGKGASINNNVLTIGSGGVYHLSGSFNGYIKINSKNTVRLIFDNIEINSENFASIYVESAEKVIITLVDGTTNKLVDTDDYKYTEEDVDATLYSKDDLVINGSGVLDIESKYEDAIVGKDELKIVSGNINIVSADDGIVGKDTVLIGDANLNIESGGDGIKATNIETGLGNIQINNGKFKIVSNNDGISAEGNIVIKDGEYNIKTNSSSSTESSKGLKSGGELVINAGTIEIDSKDDCIHSNNNIEINVGTFTLSSTDDGIHADNSLVINSGIINIKKSYEGLEGKEITINNGEISIIATDDGINAGGGADSSGNMGPMMRDQFASQEGVVLTINNGKITVDARGDGVDSNGDIIVNGGSVYVDGPTNGGNGALDYNGECQINSGIFIAAGSSDMAEPPSETSKQNVVFINFDSNQESDTKISILDSNSKEIISYTPSIRFQSMVISTSSLSKNSNYKISINGQVYTTFTIQNTITSLGNKQGNKNNNFPGNNFPRR